MQQAKDDLPVVMETSDVTTRHRPGSDEATAVCCPHCGRATAVSVPRSDAELHVRRSVALFGEHITVECSAGHGFWVYVC